MNPWLGCPWVSGQRSDLGYYGDAVHNMTSSRNHGRPSTRCSPIAVLIAIFILAIAGSLTVAPATAHAKRAKAGKVAKGKTGKSGKAGKIGKAGKTGKKRIAVVAPADAGAAAAPVAAKIASALKAHKIQVVGGAPVKKAVAKSAPTTDADWSALAAKLKVDAVIESTMSETGATNRLEIVVHNGADGSAAGRETFTTKGPPKKLAAAVGAQLWKKLGSAIQGTSAPEKGGGSALPPRDLASDGAGLDRGSEERKSAMGEPASTRETAEPEGKREKVAAADDDKKTAGAGEGEDSAHEEGEGEEGEEGEDGKKKSRKSHRDEDDGEDGGSGTGLRSVEVELALRMLRRVWQYSPASAAGPYELKFAPLVGGQASWYIIKYAGIFARGEFTTALKSGAYPTVTRELVVGAQGRYPFSSGQVSLSVAFFQHIYRILESPSTVDPSRSVLTTPDTSYTGARIGAAGRFYFTDRILAGAEGAYRLVTNPGTGPNDPRSASYFPGATVSAAFDAGGFVGVKVLDFLEARFSFDYRRYVFGKMTGRLTVAGAADDYAALNLGVVGVLGGK